MAGVIRIDRVAAYFDVWLNSAFPFLKMKVKVTERSSSDFLAAPNVAILNISTREPEYISGLGSTVEEALGDLLHRFASGVRENTPSDGLKETDFQWSASEDF